MSKHEEYPAEGRRLGSASDSHGRSSVPTKPKKPAYQGQGRKLGDSTDVSGSTHDPRSAAALAAESRNKSAAPKGALGTKLEQERRKNQSTLLSEAGTKDKSEPLIFD
ncbi:hypothetical protein CANCADRAFT_881 [Tortispora caseinolytica NRRL Y-17796]|uniref:Uncharacterized protein n=1 Tax=Tortispora caseinolytica NRRL Y-17796 TaxID=767744 RepID=A0A1E4TKP2_9ASCO|nr:hypothetical protein CANCADRAFT_881 [Tortispora caseinolytica NRRL Y-17796]